MFVAYKTTWEEKGVYWKVTGNTSVDELIHSSSIMSGDARLDDIEYYIYDGTDIEKFDYIDLSDVDRIAAEDAVSSSYKPELKGALVGTLPVLIKLFDRYLETSKKMNSSWDMRVFSTLKEARDWLDE